MPSLQKKKKNWLGEEDGVEVDFFGEIVGALYSKQKQFGRKVIFTDEEAVAQGLLPPNFVQSNNILNQALASANPSANVLGQAQTTSSSLRIAQGASQNSSLNSGCALSQNSGISETINVAQGKQGFNLQEMIAQNGLLPQNKHSVLSAQAILQAEINALGGNAQSTGDSSNNSEHTITSTLAKADNSESSNEHSTSVKADLSESSSKTELKAEDHTKVDEASDRSLKEGKEATEEESTKKSAPITLLAELSQAEKEAFLEQLTLASDSDDPEACAKLCSTLALKSEQAAEIKEIMRMLINSEAKFAKIKEERELQRQKLLANMQQAQELQREQGSQVELSLANSNIIVTEQGEKTPAPQDAVIKHEEENYNNNQFETNSSYMQEEQAGTNNFDLGSERAQQEADSDDEAYLAHASYEETSEYVGENLTGQVAADTMLNSRNMQRQGIYVPDSQSFAPANQQGVGANYQNSSNSFKTTPIAEQAPEYMNQHVPQHVPQQGAQQIPQQVPQQMSKQAPQQMQVPIQAVSGAPMAQQGANYQVTPSTGATHDFASSQNRQEFIQAQAPQNVPYNPQQMQEASQHFEGNGQFRSNQELYNGATVFNNPQEIRNLNNVQAQVQTHAQASTQPLVQAQNSWNNSSNSWQAQAYAPAQSSGVPSNTMPVSAPRAEAMPQYVQNNQVQVGAQVQNPQNPNFAPNYSYNGATSVSAPSSANAYNQNQAEGNRYTEQSRFNQEQAPQAEVVEQNRGYRKQNYYQRKDSNSRYNNNYQKGRYNRNNQDRSFTQGVNTSLPQGQGQANVSVQTQGYVQGNNQVPAQPPVQSPVQSTVQASVQASAHVPVANNMPQNHEVNSYQGTPTLVAPQGNMQGNQGFNNAQGRPLYHVANTSGQKQSQTFAQVQNTNVTNQYQIEQIPQPALQQVPQQVQGQYQEQAPQQAQTNGSYQGSHVPFSQGQINQGQINQGQANQSQNSFNYNQANNQQPAHFYQDSRETSVSSASKFNANYVQNQQSFNVSLTQGNASQAQGNTPQAQNNGMSQGNNFASYRNDSASNNGHQNKYQSNYRKKTYNNNQNKERYNNYNNRSQQSNYQNNQNSYMNVATQENASYNREPVLEQQNIVQENQSINQYNQESFSNYAAQEHQVNQVSQANQFGQAHQFSQNNQENTRQFNSGNNSQNFDKNNGNANASSNNYRVNKRELARQRYHAERNPAFAYADTQSNERQYNTFGEGPQGAIGHGYNLPSPKQRALEIYQQQHVQNAQTNQERFPNQFNQANQVNQATQANQINQNNQNNQSNWANQNSQSPNNFQQGSNEANNFFQEGNAQVASPQVAQFNQAQVGQPAQFVQPAQPVQPAQANQLAHPAQQFQQASRQEQSVALNQATFNSNNAPVTQQSFAPNNNTNHNNYKANNFNAFNGGNGSNNQTTMPQNNGRGHERFNEPINTPVQNNYNPSYQGVPYRQRSFASQEQSNSDFGNSPTPGQRQLSTQVADLDLDFDDDDDVIVPAEQVALLRQKDVSLEPLKAKFSSLQTSSLVDQKQEGEVSVAQTLLKNMLESSSVVIDDDGEELIVPSQCAMLQHYLQEHPEQHSRLDYLVHDSTQVNGQANVPVYVHDNAHTNTSNLSANTNININADLSIAHRPIYMQGSSPMQNNQANVRSTPLSPNHDQAISFNQTFVGNEGNPNTIYSGRKEIRDARVAHFLDNASRIREQIRSGVKITSNIVSEKDALIRAQKLKVWQAECNFYKDVGDRICSFLQHLEGETRQIMHAAFMAKKRAIGGDDYTKLELLGSNLSTICGYISQGISVKENIEGKLHQIKNIETNPQEDTNNILAQELGITSASNSQDANNKQGKIDNLKELSYTSDDSSANTAEENFELSSQGAFGFDVNDHRYQGSQLVAAISLEKNDESIAPGGSFDLPQSPSLSLAQDTNTQTNELPASYLSNEVATPFATHAHSVGELKAVSNNHKEQSAIVSINSSVSSTNEDTFAQAEVNREQGDYGASVLVSNANTNTINVAEGVDNSKISDTTKVSDITDDSKSKEVVTVAEASSDAASSKVHSVLEQSSTDLSLHSEQDNKPSFSSSNSFTPISLANNVKQDLANKATENEENKADNLSINQANLSLKNMVSSLQALEGHSDDDFDINDILGSSSDSELLAEDLAKSKDSELQNKVTTEASAECNASAGVEQQSSLVSDDALAIDTIKVSEIATESNTHDSLAHQEHNLSSSDLVNSKEHIVETKGATTVLATNTNAEALSSVNTSLVQSSSDTLSTDLTKDKHLEHSAGDLKVLNVAQVQVDRCAIPTNSDNNNAFITEVSQSDGGQLAQIPANNPFANNKQEFDTSKEDAALQASKASLASLKHNNLQASLDENAQKELAKQRSKASFDALDALESKFAKANAKERSRVQSPWELLAHNTVLIMPNQHKVKLHQPKVVIHTNLNHSYVADSSKQNTIKSVDIGVSANFGTKLSAPYQEHLAMMQHNYNQVLQKETNLRQEFVQRYTTASTNDAQSCQVQGHGLYRLSPSFMAFLAITDQKLAQEYGLPQVKTNDLSKTNSVASAKVNEQANTASQINHASSQSVNPNQDLVKHEVADVGINMYNLAKDSFNETSSYTNDSYDYADDSDGVGDYTNNSFGGTYSESDISYIDYDMSDGDGDDDGSALGFSSGNYIIKDFSKTNSADQKQLSQDLDVDGVFNAEENLNSISSNEEQDSTNQAQGRRKFSLNHVALLPHKRLATPDDYLEEAMADDEWYKLIKEAFADNNLYLSGLMNSERKIDELNQDKWIISIPQDVDFTSLDANAVSKMESSFEQILKRKIAVEVVTVKEPLLNAPKAKAQKAFAEALERARQNMTKSRGLAQLLNLAKEDLARVNIALYKDI